MQALPDIVWLGCVWAGFLAIKYFVSKMKINKHAGDGKQLIEKKAATIQEEVTQQMNRMKQETKYQKLYLVAYCFLLRSHEVLFFKLTLSVLL